jgi:hypothetical protein
MQGDARWASLLRVGSSTHRSRGTLELCGDWRCVVRIALRHQPNPDSVPGLGSDLPNTQPLGHCTAVGLDRFHAHAQPFGNLLGGSAFTNQPQHFQLAPAQSPERLPQVERPRGRRPQPSQVPPENHVLGSGAKTADGGLLIEGFRHNDKRCRGTESLNDSERCHSTEVRKMGRREDKIGSKAQERSSKGFLRLHPLGDDLESDSLQLSGQQGSCFQTALQDQKPETIAAVTYRLCIYHISHAI